VLVWGHTPYRPGKGKNNTMQGQIPPLDGSKAIGLAQTCDGLLGAWQCVAFAQ
jgi:hypothetical protein